MFLCICTLVIHVYNVLYQVAQENIPSFRTALCNKVIQTDEVKSTHLVSKHLQIRLKIFT